MALDIVDILRKGRHPLTSFSCTLSGRTPARRRPADSPPSRCIAASAGAVPEAAVARAAELSREKDLFRLALASRRHHADDDIRHPAMTRRGYLDWLRGVATLLMVEAHTYDAWTQRCRQARPALQGRRSRWAVSPHPGFSFSRALPWRWVPHRGREARHPGGGCAARARRRGWQVFGLAFLFRLQSLRDQRRPLPAGAVEGGHPQHPRAVDGAGGCAVAAGRVAEGDARSLFVGMAAAFAILAPADPLRGLGGCAAGLARDVRALVPRPIELLACSPGRRSPSWARSWVRGSRRPPRLTTNAR